MVVFNPRWWVTSVTAAAGGFRVERARDSSMIPPDCVDVVELTSIKSFNLGLFDFILEKKNHEK